MKKIVIPSDFSKDAEKAYYLASNLAKKSGAEIVILHVLENHLKFIDSMPYDVFDTDLIFTGEEKEEFSSAAEKMKRVLELEVFRGVKVDYFISDSLNENPLKVVLDFLNRGEHSIVILGTSGDDTFGDSCAEFVARRAVVPVISVKDTDENFELKKILLSTDFKTIDKRFMKRITQIAFFMDAQIEFAYINTPKRFKDTDYIEKEWDRFKNRYKIKTDVIHIFNDHDVELGILKVLARSKANMLAVPTHGRTGLSHVFKGSYVEDIINESSVPVFSYNMSNDYHPSYHNRMGTTGGLVG